MPPPDPNKKMEDLLRAYAKKRREEAGAPFELSPDVRARLQEEVRRALGRTAVPKRPSWGLSLAGWLRMGLWGAVAAVMVLTLLNNAPTKAKSKQFVQAEKKAGPPELTSTTPLSPAVATVPPVEAGPVQMTNRLVAAVPAPVSDGTREIAASEKSKTALELAAAPSGTASTNVVAGVNDSNVFAATGPEEAGGMGGGFGGGGGGRARGRAGRGGGGGRRGGGGGGGGGGGFGGGGGEEGGLAGKALPSAAPGAAPAASTISSASGKTEIAVTLQSPSLSAQPMTRSQPPLNRARAGAAMRRAEEAASPAADVLASFQIERTGQEVRIVDADGSVYQGPVVNAEAQAKTRTANQSESLKDFDKLNGTANVTQERAYGNNFAAQKNGYGDAAASQGELPPKTANLGALQNQGQMIDSDVVKSGGPAPSGTGGAFTFQASGLNRKLNQTVIITGSCVIAPAQPGAGFNNSDSSNLDKLQANNYAATAAELKTAPARPPASQSQNILENNTVNFKNTQNIAPPIQYWRVTGQVQVGPSNHFDLDAANAHP